MGIFRFTQGQLTLQSLVRSTPNSNSVQSLWLSSIPQDNMIFFFVQGQITLKSVVGSGRNSNSSKFLCMCLFVTCKNEEDRMKNEFAGVAGTFLPL